jgi:hypothetical protein
MMTKVQQLINEIEEATANGQHGYAEELNYELDELCNAADEELG